MWFQPHEAFVAILSKCLEQKCLVQLNHGTYIMVLMSQWATCFLVAAIVASANMKSFSQAMMPHTKRAWPHGTKN